MSNLTTAFVFVLIVNLLLFFTNTAISSATIYDGTTPQSLFNCNNSILNKGSNQCRSSLTNPESNLPIELTGTQPDSANTFISLFTIPLSWIKSVGTFLLDIVLAFHNLLTRMNLPLQFVVGIDSLWYLICTLIIVGFLLGRDV